MRVVHARAEIYQMLAELLAGPHDPLTRAACDQLADAARALGSPAGLRAAAALARSAPLTAADLRAHYARLLHTAGRPPAFHESLACGGHLGGPAVGAVERIYHACGVHVAGDELADHASVELAFMAHLATVEAECPPAELETLRLAERHFWREHAARWLPALGRALAAGDDDFYAEVGQWLTAFLAEETRRVAGRQKPASGAAAAIGGQSRRRMPALVAADQCTLCGFCVQVCDPRALWIEESKITTQLMFDAARCVGCALCLKTCPEHVLRMVRRDTADSAAHALRASQRECCPICATPTVSAAELEAVFARVDADDDMRARMSLCAECKTYAEVWR